MATFSFFLPQIPWATFLFVFLPSGGSAFNKAIETELWQLYYFNKPFMLLLLLDISYTHLTIPNKTKIFAYNQLLCVDLKLAYMHTITIQINSIHIIIWLLLQLYSRLIQDLRHKFKFSRFFWGNFKRNNVSWLVSHLRDAKFVSITLFRTLTWRKSFGCLVVNGLNLDKKRRSFITFHNFLIKDKYFSFN